ncbi:MAG TPA: DUF2852 domain-containing protein [Saliniramus sp.]|nr:DUF2852 domain-containing protein [Saliniramus sp.]
MNTTTATMTGGARQDKSRRWKTWEILAIVFGFIIYWPVGLALLIWKLWRLKEDQTWDFSRGFDDLRNSFNRSGFAGNGFGGASGNSAFDEYKRETLERLESERRKLAEEEREFANFMDELRRTRDRESFDRFMQSRRNASQ